MLVSRYKKKTSLISVVFTCVFILIGFSFYELNLLVNFPIQRAIKLSAVFFLALFIFLLPKIAKDERFFLFWVISIIFSFFSANVFMQQNLLVTFDAGAYLFCFLFYFYLKLLKLHSKKIFKIICFFGSLHVVFFYVNVFTNTSIFGFKELLQTLDSGIVKFRFPGRVFSYFSFFYLLYLFLSKKKITYFLLILL